MRCNNCGNEIPAGFPNCPVCGAPAAQGQPQPQQFGAPQGQPQQFGAPQGQPQGFPGPQQFGAPQGQYANPYPPRPAVFFYPGGPFAQRIKGDYTMICSFVGAFFVFLFTCIPAWVTGWGQSIGLFNDNLNGLVKFSAVLLILVNLWLIFRYLVVYNVIPGINLTRLTNLPGSEWYGPAGVLLLFFIVTFNGDIQDAVKGTGIHFGVSWWFALIGTLLLFVRPLVFVIKGQKFHTGERIIRQQAQSYAYQRPAQPYGQPQQFGAPQGQPQQFGAPQGQPQQFGAPQGQPQQFGAPQDQQPGGPIQQ